MYSIKATCTVKLYLNRDLPSARSRTFRLNSSLETASAKNKYFEREMI